MCIQLLFLLLLTSQTAAVYTQNGIFLTVNDESNGQVSSSTTSTQVNMFFQYYSSVIGGYTGAPTNVTMLFDPSLSQGAVSAWSTGFGLSVSNLNSNPNDSGYLQFAVNFMLQSYPTKAPTTVTTTRAPATTTPKPSPNTYVRNGLTLIVNDESNGKIPNSTIQAQVNAFFQLYPQTVQAQIRAGTPTTLTLTFDPTLPDNTVAASSNQLVLSVNATLENPTNTLMLQAAINQSISGFGYGRNGYYVTVQNSNSGVTSDTIQNIINTFFTAYPQEVAYYKPQTPIHNLTFIFDANFTAAAAITEVGFSIGANNALTPTSADIRFNAAFLKSNPSDWDMVTHEAMHVTQYGGGVSCSNNPVWLIEGMADFARNKFGVANAAAGWSLPNYSSSQNYTDGYSDTAAFINFCLRYNQNLDTSLFTMMQQCQYTTSGTWSQLTGMTVNQLWQQYANSASGR